MILEVVLGGTHTHTHTHRGMDENEEDERREEDRNVSPRASLKTQARESTFACTLSHYISVSPHFFIVPLLVSFSHRRGTTTWRQLTMCILITTLSPGLAFSRLSLSHFRDAGDARARVRGVEALSDGDEMASGQTDWGQRTTAYRPSELSGYSTEDKGKRGCES